MYYLLTVNIVSFIQDSYIFNNLNYNGYYQLYTDDKNKAETMLDLLKLLFLRMLTPCEEFVLCLCDYKNNIKNCKYCSLSKKQYKNLKDLKKTINEQGYKGFDLSKKDDYIFPIDIYETRQCGCEEQIRFKDIESGVLFKKYSESYNSKYGIKHIPIFEHSLKIVEKIPESYEKFINFVLYNGKFIKYSVFIEMLNNPDYCIYEIIDKNSNFIIDRHLTLSQLDDSD